MANGFPDLEKEFPDKPEKKKNDLPKNAGFSIQTNGIGIPEELLSHITSLLKGITDEDDVDGDEIDDEDDFEVEEGDMDEGEEECDDLSSLKKDFKNKRNSLKLRNSGNFTILKRMDFDPVPVKNTNILNEFYQDFSEKLVYTASDFINEVKNSGLVIKRYSSSNSSEDMIENIETFTLIDSTDNYILFKAGTKKPDIEEDFVIAMSKDVDDEWVLYVPIYGNSLLVEGSDVSVIDRTTQADFFDDLGALKVPANISKIKAEIDLMFYRRREYMTSVADFGKIFHVLQPSRYCSDLIQIGSIVSNKSFKSKTFVKDYNLDDSTNSFPFYVKLKTTLNANELDSLSEFLTGLDFNTNQMIQESEIFPVMGNHGIAINLGLENLAANILSWKFE